MLAFPPTPEAAVRLIAPDDSLTGVYDYESQVFSNGHESAVAAWRGSVRIGNPKTDRIEYQSCPGMWCGALGYFEIFDTRHPSAGAQGALVEKSEKRGEVQLVFLLTDQTHMAHTGTRTGNVITGTWRIREHTDFHGTFTARLRGR
jgi:hypothetical protein